MADEKVTPRQLAERTVTVRIDGGLHLIELMSADGCRLVGLWSTPIKGNCEMYRDAAVNALEVIIKQTLSMVREGKIAEESA